MAHAPSSFLDAALCPLCGQPNRCAMEMERASGTRQPPCWCLQAQFDPRTLEQVPPSARGRACICTRCASRHGPA